MQAKINIITKPMRNLTYWSTSTSTAFALSTPPSTLYSILKIKDLERMWLIFHISEHMVLNASEK